MPNYHLLVRLTHESPMTAISINLNSRDEALIAAQRYDAPAELWDGDTHVCTITRSNYDGAWIISKKAAPLEAKTVPSLNECQLSPRRPVPRPARNS